MTSAQGCKAGLAGNAYCLARSPDAADERACHHNLSSQLVITTCHHNLSSQLVITTCHHNRTRPSGVRPNRHCCVAILVKSMPLTADRALYCRLSRHLNVTG